MTFSLDVLRLNAMPSNTPPRPVLVNTTDPNSGSRIAVSVLLRCPSVELWWKRLFRERNQCSFFWETILSRMLKKGPENTKNTLQWSKLEKQKTVTQTHKYSPNTAKQAHFPWKAVICYLFRCPSKEFPLLIWFFKSSNATMLQLKTDSPFCCGLCAPRPGNRLRNSWKVYWSVPRGSFSHLKSPDIHSFYAVISLSKNLNSNFHTIWVCMSADSTEKAAINLLLLILLFALKHFLVIFHVTFQPVGILSYSVWPHSDIPKSSE